MKVILDVWQRMAASNRTLSISNGEATLVLGAIEVDTAKNVATLLVRLSNTKTPNSVYSDPANGTFDEHVKVGNQGADFGCHVLISTAPECEIPNTYTCAIERVSGLPPSFVQRLLSKLLNYEYNENDAFFNYPRPGGGVGRDGQPRTERCCPHIDLRGRPSDTLIADINAGHITGVSLVKNEPVQPLGGSSFLSRKSSELKLSINHGSLPADIWNGVKSVLAGQASEYPVAKLSYKLPDAKRTVTVQINSETGAPLEELYVKMFEITEIFPFLAQSAPSIVGHLRDKAVPIMIAHRNV